MQLSQVMNVESRLQRINANFPVIESVRSKDIKGYKFCLVGTKPGRDHYLALNYDLQDTMPSGIIDCHDDAEVEMFFDLLEKRLEGSEPFDYQNVLNAFVALRSHALGSAADKHTDIGCSDPEVFPFQGKPVPWVTEEHEIEDIEDANLIYTANWSSLYGSLGDIPQPTDQGYKEDKSLLFIICSDIGGEELVELCDAGDCFGLTEGSLEWFLWCQLLSHGKNLAREKPEYASFRYDAMGGVWLAPAYENVEFLPKIVEYDDFQRFYEKEDTDTLIAEWCKATLEVIKDSLKHDEYDYEEAQEKLDTYLRSLV